MKKTFRLIEGMFYAHNWCEDFDDIEIIKSEETGIKYSCGGVVKELTEAQKILLHPLQNGESLEEWIY